MERASSYKKYGYGYGEKDPSPKYDIVYACQQSNIEKVNELIRDTKFSAFELLECVIDKWWICSIDIFEFLLSRITQKEINTTFIATDEKEYTLLIYLCKLASLCKFFNNTLYMLIEKITAFVKYGADLNQIVGEETGLSYLVRLNSIETVKKCIDMGADPTKGYLLINSINVMPEEKYNDRLPYFEDMNVHLPRILKHERRYNQDMFQYLCGLGLNPNEIQPSTGMNTLIGVCSEGDTNRLDILILFFKGLFQLDIDVKTPAGLTAMDWAMRHKDNHSLANRLEIYINTKKNEFKEVMYETYVDTIRHNEKLIFDGFHNCRFKQVVVSFLIEDY